MKVSLAPPVLISATEKDRPREGFLDPEGAFLILGGFLGPNGEVAPVRPQPDTLFGPRGACLAGEDGPLFVCDTGHHRLLIWQRVPKQDQTPADLIIGQDDFFSEGRNGGQSSALTGLNVPTGVCAQNGILAVADADNHRVLLWHGYPERSQQPPDVILGKGVATAGPDGFNRCFGVFLTKNGLIVCDTGNRRVLIWHTVPQKSGMPADLVLGQAGFLTHDEGAGGRDPGSAMGWPHMAATDAEGRLFIADAGRNRVAVWQKFPQQNGTACDFVLGQRDLAGRDANRGLYHATAGSFNMPYGVCVSKDRLIVADTANSRLLASRIAISEQGAPASFLAGQQDWWQRGDNRWKPAARDSLCWPYGVTATGQTVVVADSGNNRVLLWRQEQNKAGSE